MNIIKHKYGKRTVSLLLAVILVLCPLQVRAADNKPTIEIGDYIQMGTYGGEPIVWRCVAKDSNGPLMLSDRVLCDYMPYDAKTNKNAETGSHRRNSWRDNFGSNHWRDSNIRSWLNSNAEAGKVKWLCGNPPTEDSVYPKTAAYDQKEGFLRSFRSDELGAIRTVKQRSIVSHPEYTAGYIDAAGVDLPYNTTIDTVADGYDSAHYEYIWDRVFLLDVQQLKTVNDNLNGYHIAKNRSGVAWNYWLRTPITTCNHDMRFVTPQGNILRDAPYKGYYGVRPAFYLNTENYTVSSGTGQSAQDPYVVSAPDAPDDSIGISGAVREDVNGDWNVNTDEYLQLEMSTLYTEDPAYANVTVPVYTIQKPRSDKENMVIVYCAEGYTKSQQKQFVEDVKKLWGEVLQIEPYRSMADRFNVYALCTASVDGYGGTSTFFAATAKGGISTNKGNWRNHVLERIIGPAFIEKIHDAHIPNETHPNENTMDHNYRQYDYVYENINQFVVLANSGEYFGGSHDNKQYGIHYIVASARNAYSAFTQRHELGHGLFHLGDEYNYSTVPVDEWNYTTSLNMTATKDPTKVKWKQLLGFRNTYTCPHLDYYPYTYNSSRDCLMRETFQNDFCDVCKLQGIKVMSQLITNPPALYVAVPEVKKYIGGYRNPTKDPSAFEAANSSAYASYQNDRNSRLLSGGSKNSFDYSSMKGQQVELRTIIQNLSNTQAKTVTLRLWVEHSNGEKAVTTDGEQVFTTQEFDIPVWKEKSKFWTKGALDYEGSDFNSGLVNCSLVYTIPENAILQSGDTIGFEIVDHATGEVLADDDTEQQHYVNVTIQYQLEDGTDVPNTMPTTFTVPVGKKVDWQPPQELHGYTFVKAEGMENAVPNSGMTIRYIYKRSEERPEPPVTKNYTVQYNWGSVFPTGATLPLNSSSYSSVQQAKAAVDKKYTSTTRIQAQKDGKNGTWAFSGWDAGNLNGTTVVFRGSWSFTADTAPITPPSGTASYKITATAGIGGTISPGGTTTVSAAGQLTYTIKANEGYYIADVKVDGSEVTATTSYTFSDVNTDHTIEVTFKQESQTPDVPDVIAPSITTQPGNATVKVGETASFTIAASGTDLTYQWQIDRNDGKGWVNIDGATATSYTTSTVNISCNGFKYKCVVSNSAGNVESNSATLTVQDAGITPPSGTASYKITATAGIGGTISPGGTTTVSAAGQLTYTIKANEGYYIADVKVDGSEVTATTSYTFSDVNTDHTIEVTFKQESQTPDVPDVIAPSITTQPGNATVKVGETASFTIAASGTDLTYQWQIDRNDGKGWVNIDGATATSYTTSTVNISCNGFKYKCVVSNSAGNVESNSATLTVQDAGGSDNPDTPNNTYQIIDGANSSWTHDSDGNITIRGNGDFSKFTGVKVDGNLIDRSNYTAKEGSTIITLKASYLNTLSAGTNTVEILWTDGSASTTFTIKANTSDNSNNNQNDNNNSDSSDDKPSSGTDKKDVTALKTGDNTPSVWLFILLILSGTGLIITVKKRRENLNS